jgi:hypothetical protein
MRLGQLLVETLLSCLQFLDWQRVEKITVEDPRAIAHGRVRCSMPLTTRWRVNLLTRSVFRATFQNKPHEDLHDTRIAISR